MAKSDPAARYAALIAEIEKHNRAYYTEAAPTISDYDYDQLYRELVGLEAAHPDLARPDSPTQKVGAAPLGEFAPYPHEPRMQSGEWDGSKMLRGQDVATSVVQVASLPPEVAIKEVLVYRPGA